MEIGKTRINLKNDTKIEFQLQIWKNQDASTRNKNNTKNLLGSGVEEYVCVEPRKKRAESIV